MKDPKEELALPLKGKKNNLSKKDFLTYFAVERLAINQQIIDEILDELIKIIPSWHKLIDHSFLSQQMKENYHDLLKERDNRLLS